MGRSGWCVWVLVGMVGTSAAQDRRQVQEPVIPPVCAVLKAQLTSQPSARSRLQPADEQQLDTARLQKGIDACAEGKALELALDGKHDAFLTAPLEMRKGVTLLVDRGVTLYGSRNPRDYDTAPGSCGVVNNLRGGCRALISGKNAPNSAIMGDGTIDGRGGSKLLVDGKEQAKSWWDLAEDARAGGHQQVPRLLVMDASDNFTLYRITLKNSGFFHVTYNHGHGFTVWGLKIDTPRHARNTDGVDPGASSDITVTHSYIRDGDDNIAIKGGPGGVTHMSVVDNHFYWGHGMSIGSETDGGVSAIVVRNLSLDGDDNALRIKSNPSRGGLVHNVLYDNICIRDSKNPILLNTNYNYPGTATNHYPVYRDIVFRNVRVEGGGKITMQGMDAAHRLSVQLDGVELKGPLSSYKFAIQHTQVRLGPGPVNFPVKGEDTTVEGSAGSGKMEGCAAMFVPFPEER